MIPAIQLLYRLDQRINKVGTNANQGITDPDKLLALNEAQIKLVKKKVSGNNIYGIGMDGFKKRYQDLENLVVVFEKTTPAITTQTRHSYKVAVTDLKNRYMFPLEMYCLCSKDQCTERPVYISGYTRHGDLRTMESNTHYAPSFGYQDTLAQETGNEVIIYANDPQGDFKVDEVYISYLRYPKEIDIAGYTKLNGDPSTDSDCELEAYLEDELLTLAEMELAIMTGNTELIQANSLKEKSGE